MFNFEYQWDGYYKIIARHSGMALDVYNSEQSSGANVEQYPWKNSDNQKWVVKPAGDGYYYIVSKGNGLYLDVYGGVAVNDANIDTYFGHGGASEKWRLIPVNEPENLLTVKGCSVSLKENIGVNMYASFSDDILEDDGAKVRFTYADNSYIEVPLSNYMSTTYNNENVKKITFDTVPAKLTEKIKVSVIKSDDTQTNMFSFSTSDYLYALINSTDKSIGANQKNIAKALLNYGAYSQIYFGVDTADLANKKLTDNTVEKTDSDTVIKSIQGQENGLLSNKDFEYIGSSLVCDSSTDLKLYFVNKSRLTMKQIENQIDLSELHLAYYAYNSLLDPLGGTEGDYAKYYMNNTSVQYGYLNRGGNYLMAARRMGQWCGPVSESDVPYSKVASNGYTASTIDTFLNTGLSDEYAYSKDKAHLENTYMINIKENASDVKKAIKKYGAVGIMYSHNDTGYHYINNSYNDKTNNRAGHAVMVVGWDDNYSKDNFRYGVKPEKDGAWLIRNSWGDGTGSYYNQSYFWMSYETFSLSDTAWVFDFSANDGYDNNYQVDGGLNVAHQSSCRKLANVFTTQTKQGVSSEDLKAVSLSITSKTNVNYTIEIYTDLKDKTKPISGTKQETATTTGQTTYAGVYTIPLKSAVNLKPGTSYSVVVTTDTPAVDIEAAMTGDVNYNNEMVWENHASSDNTASYYFYGTGLAYSRSWNYQNTHGNFCIKAFTANNVEKDSEKLVGRSLTLKDNIDMNYYMELPESIKSNSNAYMEFTVNSSQLYKVSVNDAIPVEKNGKVIYKFACPINAAQMSDTVKAKMVVDGSSGNEYTYSVKEYATELLSKSNEYPAETIKLVKALLNYGTAAQNFFKYNTDKPANAGLSDTDKAVAAADFEEYKAVIKTDSANSQSNGLTYYGSSLICKSEMTVRHYFMVNEGCDINNYKFSYVNADGNEVSLTPKKASDGVYCVDINGIMARNLNSIFACKVTEKNKACILELDYGPFSYSQKVINSGNSSAELKNLVNALYWYWYYGYRN